MLSAFKFGPSQWYFPSSFIFLAAKMPPKNVIRSFHSVSEGICQPSGVILRISDISYQLYNFPRMQFYKFFCNGKSNSKSGLMPNRSSLGLIKPFKYMYKLIFRYTFPTVANINFNLMYSLLLLMFQSLEFKFIL
jgi:hypothetical protein